MLQVILLNKTDLFPLGTVAVIDTKNGGPSETYEIWHLGFCGVRPLDSNGLGLLMSGEPRRRRRYAKYATPNFCP